jgi:hypothetical protein
MAGKRGKLAAKLEDVPTKQPTYECTVSESGAFIFTNIAEMECPVCGKPIDLNVAHRCGAFAAEKPSE